MTRDQQFEAIIATVQSIDACIASIIIQEPEVFPTLPVLSRATGISWHVGSEPRVIHASTLTSALLWSGMIHMRLLSNVLGVTTTIKTPQLKDIPQFPPTEGGNIHWSHIENARGIGVQDIQCFTAGEYGIRVENDRVIPFDEVYLQVMKGVDKSIAHLTHENEWSKPYLGGIVTVGIFLIVIAQEALLKHSWGETFDEVVLRNSKHMLPDEHFAQYLTTVSEFRLGVLQMLSSVSSIDTSNMDQA